MARALVKDIITLAARIWGISRDDIIGPARNRRFVHPRHAVYLIAREHEHSFSQIGRVVNRDHTTIIHGERTCGVWMEHSPEYLEQVCLLRRQAQDCEAFLAEREVQIELPIVFVPKVPLPRPKKKRNVFSNGDGEFSREADWAAHCRLANPRFVDALLEARAA